jgi:multidrug efflux pump subunit AcrA (membrane-fusion protein)
MRRTDSDRTPSGGDTLLPSICLALLLLALAGVGGCSRGQSAEPPPPPQVTVNRPLQREVVEWDEFTGHLESPQFVEVRARVSGQIVDAPFKEGATVKQGDTLFVIDKRPFKADYDSKLADVNRAQAQLDLANIQVQRTIEELKSNAVAKAEYDNAAANVKQAEAVLAPRPPPICRD